MAIRSFANKEPRMSELAYVDEMAVVIGDVDIDEDSSIWPMVVVRGDINSIRIGKRTSIQDGSVIHVNHVGEFNPAGNPVIIGDDVTVGHKALLHGCQIADRCLIGMGSIIMDGAFVESDIILGAGSLVPRNKVLHSGYLWLGNPVEKIRALTENELRFLRYSANYYVQLQRRYRLDKKS